MAKRANVRPPFATDKSQRMSFNQRSLPRLRKYPPFGELMSFSLPNVTVSLQISVIARSKTLERHLMQ